MPNILLALQLLLELGAQAQGLLQLIATAQAAGRDLTPDELATVKSAFTAAHATLDADLAAGAPKTA